MMSTKCPKCHTNNPDDSKFCKECATPLEMHAKTITVRTPAKESATSEIISEKYKLLEELGSGGMGIVYKAEQLKPVKRSVALKIIKLGMDTRQVVARFESERQALAVMDHPNIAKVFDGGATEKGRPYFVMELVRGIPITQYCDKHNLTIRERLELFIPLCQAVQHAHQKGVIHRDLKPSNVLVSYQEDKSVPKVIDFGIARATEHRLTERTLFTEQGQLIGTPEYMSPEQAEMSGLDVDTRTDIYSLGVMLYELLVGALPFDSSTLREAGFGKIQQIIRDIEPQKASTRLSGLGDTQTSIAEQRKTDPPSLHRELKGDLDWITMKAMAKDRTRRYSSVSELAVDIERHLKNEPILASPPSTLYRIKKYIRRHKVGVAAAVIILVAILVGITGTSLGLIRARKSEQIARTEADKAKAINAFMQEILGSANPEIGLGQDATILEALDSAEERISEAFPNQPEIEADLKDTIGWTYVWYAHFEDAERLLKEALEIRKSLFGEEHPSVADSLYHLGVLRLDRKDQTRNDEDAAEEIFQSVLAMRRRLLGDKHSSVAEVLNALAIINHRRSDHEIAESLYREALGIQREVLGKEHYLVAKALGNLAGLLRSKGDLERAETLNHEAIGIYRSLYDRPHPGIATLLNNLGLLYLEKKNYDAAERFCRESLEMARQALGDKHPEVPLFIQGLVRVLLESQKYDEAEAFIREAISISREVHGKDHLYVSSSLSLYGIILTRLSRYEEAEARLLEALTIIQSGSPRSRIIEQLVELYEAWGKTGEAAKYRSMLRKAQTVKQSKQ
ncbi:MAG: tetratricopeptide repeat protein [Candidatus Aminicenantes bacterium]